MYFPATIHADIHLDDCDLSVALRVRASPRIRPWSGPIENCPSDVDYYGEPPRVDSIEHIEEVILYNGDSEIVLDDDLTDELAPLILSCLDISRLNGLLAQL